VNTWPKVALKKDANLLACLKAAQRFIEHFTESEEDSHGAIFDFFLQESFIAMIGYILEAVESEIEKTPDFKPEEIERMFTGVPTTMATRELLEKEAKEISDDLRKQKKTQIVDLVKKVVIDFFEKRDALEEMARSGRLPTITESLGRERKDLMKRLQYFAQEITDGKIDSGLLAGEKSEKAKNAGEGVIKEYNALQAAAIGEISVLKEVEKAEEKVELPSFRKAEITILPVKDKERDGFRVAYVDITLDRKNKHATTLRLSIFRGDYPICIGESIIPLEQYVSKETYELLRYEILDRVLQNLKNVKNENEDLLFAKTEAFAGVEADAENSSRAETEGCTNEMLGAGHVIWGFRREVKEVLKTGKKPPEESEIKDKEVGKKESKGFGILKNVTARRALEILISLSGKPPVTINGSHFGFQMGEKRMCIPLHLGGNINPYTCGKILKDFGLLQRFCEML
jgi:predicted RNA binding protein YcfA (HicA-like mRNA interferase family)